MRFLIAILVLVPWLSPDAAQIAKFPSISVANTNFSSELIVTNGITLGGVRETAWPGGETLWTSYTATDVEGGTVYGTSSTNIMQSGIVDFAVNNLANLWGGYSTVFKVGVGYDFTPQTADQIAQSNSEIILLGDSPFWGNAIFTNNTAIFSMSDGFLGDGSVMINSTDVIALSGGFTSSSFDSVGSVYSIGNNFTHSALTNGGAIYALARYAFNDSIIIGGGYLATFGGTHDFQNSELKSCLYIIGVGNENYKLAHWATNQYINAFGYGNFESSTLTNSEHLYAFGQDNGQSITGSYTNIYLYGRGAVPTRRVDQQVFGGTEMQNLFPGGVASVDTTAPVGISATGWTNSFDKSATVYWNGTAATAVVYNNAGTAVSTNTCVVGQTGTINLQSNGKMIVTGGTAISGTAVPF